MSMIKYDELTYFYLTEKKTLTELSKIFKKSPSWIRYLLIKKCKIKVRSKKESGKVRKERTLQLIKEELKQNPTISQQQLSNKLNISRLTIRRLTRGIKSWLTYSTS